MRGHQNEVTGEGLRIRDRALSKHHQYGTYIVNIITVRVVGHGYASFEITGVGSYLRSYTAEIPLPVTGTQINT
jgi:hypothetical protein